MPDKATIIKRVLKLFDLAQHQATGGQQGTTEAEIHLAMSKARQMMADHDISMAEVKLAGGGKLEYVVSDHIVYTRKIKDFAEYDYRIARAVNVLTDTEMIHLSYRGMVLSHLQFIGAETDVAIAAELFHIFLSNARKFARQAYGQKWGKSHTSYCMGFGDRLHQRARVLKAPPPGQTMALVLASKTAAINQWKEQKQVYQKPPRKTELDQMAYFAGSMKGNTYDMGHGKRITATTCEHTW